jgi:hypothetical protein
MQQNRDYVLRSLESVGCDLLKATVRRRMAGTGPELLICAAFDAFAPSR